MIDSCGNRLELGDVVRVVLLDASRGAREHLTDCDGIVGALGRSRVTVMFPSRYGAQPFTIGPETLLVVRPGPIASRALRTPSDCWAER